MGKKRKILQVQINPHFFYNTLNSMMALNRMGEKKKLEKSIMNLADLCRYSSLGGEETATIEDECMIQKQYLDLEKLKYDDRIEYEIYVDRDCRYREIPRLLLQPILENSIVHGIGNGSITITIRVSSEEVTGRGVMTKISISDNGVGFDADTLVEEENSGIAGVKSRARQFDSEMLFSCSSKPGEGTQTVLMFRENQMT